MSDDDVQGCWLGGEQPELQPIPAGDLPPITRRVWWTVNPDTGELVMRDSL